MTSRISKRPDRPAGVAAVRCWSDLAWLGGAAVVLVLSALPVDADHLSSAERIAFRVVNDPTVMPFVIVWPLMQLGNVVVVGVAALAAVILRRARLAVSIVVGGIAAYVLAKVVKRIIERGRPDDLLTDVTIRGEPSAGLGMTA